MFEVIEAGLYTTIQDYPGRVGYWPVGIPPSGPMDAFAFRAANALVGNPESYAALEITALGPTLQFHDEAIIALTGVKLAADLDGEAVPWWRAVRVSKGGTLTLKGLQGPGFRAYLAIAHGIDVPLYLGSRSTFPFGHFGGLDGRPLAKGDKVRTFAESAVRDEAVGLMEEDDQPIYGGSMEIGAVLGPHAAPDFFTRADVEMFYDTEWSVHYNSNRLGYRLVGPSPEFAREHGGEGGRHPSNIPDTAYAIGTVNFTGDMPVILTVDGPSLGGFVCMATIPTCELWKVGQTMPGAKLRFRPMTVEESVKGAYEQRNLLTRIRLAS